MNKKIFIIGSILLGIMIVGILLWPIISGITAVLHGIAAVERLESRICSQEYYEPVAKDLALICSNIKPDFRMYDPNGIRQLESINSIWWPKSIKTLNPLYGYLSSDGACVLFTRGFTHLSYVLEKVPGDSTSSSKWELYFEDEGRSKLLTAIELTGNESFDLDNMFHEAFEEYELMTKQNLDSTQIKVKEYFLSLFDQTENAIIK
jgi:hypothetical protein